MCRHWTTPFFGVGSVHAKLLECSVSYLELRRLKLMYTWQLTPRLLQIICAVTWVWGSLRLVPITCTGIENRIVMCHQCNSSFTYFFVLFSQFEANLAPQSLYLHTTCSCILKPCICFQEQYKLLGHHQTFHRQVENAEVWKLKYGNGSTKVRRKAAYRCLEHYWLTTVPCSQMVTVSKRCENQALTHWTPASTNTVV